MPEVKKAKPQAAEKPAPKPAPKEEPKRPILYPEVEVNGVVIPAKNLNMTCQRIMDMLGWEDEDSYKARVEAEAKAKGDVRKGAQAIVGYGDDYLLKDGQGRKVRCHNNHDNRPFEEALALAYKQDHLNLKWRLNGEPFIVGQTGRVISGQHSGIGYVLACQERDKLGKEHPPFQRLMVCGIDESQETIATVDNCRARKLSDTIYTSPLFERLNPFQRKECSRMMDAAVDLLWKRTQANQGDRSKYQTHAASLDFLDRHGRLKKAVKHIFEENQSRSLSILKLSPGQCSAMLYLMAACGSDGDDYRNANPAPSERKIDFKYWDKAEEFFTLLAGDAEELKPVRKVLAGLKDDEERMLNVRRLACLSLAWNQFKAGEELDEESVTPAYVEVDGKLVLPDWPNVGGIDLGDHKDDAKKDGGEEEELTEKQLEERKAQAREELARQAKAKVEAAKKPKPVGPTASTNDQPTSLTDLVADVCKKHPGKTVIFKGEVACTIFGTAAERAKEALQLKVSKDRSGLSRMDFNSSGLDVQVDKLLKAGHAVAIRTSDGKVVDVPPLAKPAPITKK